MTYPRVSHLSDNRQIANAVNQALKLGEAAGTGGGTGTVTTTGTPASGNLTKFSGTTSITNGDLSGDVTTSGGLATAIANGAVSLAKMANMATASVIYRKTAGTGAPEVQTLATLKSDLGLTGTNSGDQTITLSGDVSGSGTSAITVTATGRLIGRQIFTSGSGATYTPTSGTRSVIIEMVGGGGGGGGATAGSSATSVAGCGSGGGYIRKRLTANFSGGTYTVGGGGGGGSAGNNAGSDGGDTTFTDTAGSPTTYTAGKGKGGVAGVSGTGVGVQTLTVGGTGTNGDLNISGSPGQSSVRYAGSSAFGGIGGDSHFGRGGEGSLITATNQSFAGKNGTGYGGGGSPAVVSGTASAAAGGSGAAGVIIVWEYS